MRLIDTDVLKEWVENWLYKDRYYHNGRVGKTIPITELYDLLEQIPTVDVPDRKGGEWVYDTNFCGLNRHTCSVCGKGEFRMSDYCPNCGADMKGEDDAEV